MAPSRKACPSGVCGDEWRSLRGIGRFCLRERRGAVIRCARSATVA